MPESHMPRIEVVPCKGSTSAGHPHFWRLVGGNGETQSVGESYPSRADAIRGVGDALDSVARILASPDPTDHVRVVS